MTGYGARYLRWGWAKKKIAEHYYTHLFIMNLRRFGFLAFCHLKAPIERVSLHHEFDHDVAPPPSIHPTTRRHAPSRHPRPLAPPRPLPRFDLQHAPVRQWQLQPRPPLRLPDRQFAPPRQVVPRAALEVGMLLLPHHEGHGGQSRVRVLREVDLRPFPPAGFDPDLVNPLARRDAGRGRRRRRRVRDPQPLRASPEELLQAAVHRHGAGSPPPPSPPPL